MKVTVFRTKGGFEFARIRHDEPQAQERIAHLIDICADAQKDVQIEEIEVIE